jgi:hypothetical protein
MVVQTITRSKGFDRRRAARTATASAKLKF